MNKTFYIFTEYWAGQQAIFDNEKDLKFFIKDFEAEWFNETLTMPGQDDYGVQKITSPVNQKFIDWWNSHED